MKAGMIEGATRVLGAPLGWNAQMNGECIGLPIREARLESGQPVMISAWKPTREELDRLLAGAAIELGVCGVVHPPVSMGVGPAPAKLADEVHVTTDRAEANAAAIREAVGRAIPIETGEELAGHPVIDDAGAIRCPKCLMVLGHLADCEQNQPGSSRL